MNLRTLDLNLLRVFDVVMTERSVITSVISVVFDLHRRGSVLEGQSPGDRP